MRGEGGLEALSLERREPAQVGEGVEAGAWPHFSWGYDGGCGGIWTHLPAPPMRSAWLLVLERPCVVAQALVQALGVVAAAPPVATDESGLKCEGQAACFRQA